LRNAAAIRSSAPIRVANGCGVITAPSQGWVTENEDKDV
jgi:hypothetical protein